MTFDATTDDFYAMTPARVGVARVGATRLGFIPENVAIDGTDPLYAFFDEFRAVDDDVWTEEILDP